MGPVKTVGVYPLFVVYPLYPLGFVYTLVVKCVFVYVYVVVCGLFPPLYMSSTDVVPISTGNSVLDSFLASVMSFFEELV